MKKGDIIRARITRVRMHKEERMMQGEPFGTYQSNYVAELNGNRNSIAVIDEYAKRVHPDWLKKTEQRAQILNDELKNKFVDVCVKDVFYGKDCFEGEVLCWET